MSEPLDLRIPVRRELGLEALRRKQNPRRFFGSIAAAAGLLGALAAGSAAAQAPYRLEVIPGFSSLSFQLGSSLELADLDSDGDLDGIVGDLYGRLRYFRNRGTATAPAFIEETGSANPFDDFDVGVSSSPVLADLDGDGDLDALVGESGLFLFYFENVGSSIAPRFLEVTGAANPFFGITLGSLGNPDLIDLDGDGDFDAVVGDFYGGLTFLLNSGSSNAPAFVVRSGSDNPFDGLNFGYQSSPCLVDLDGDGDLDAVVGEEYGRLRYLANTGNSLAPGFVEWVSGANPFNGINVEYSSTPELADVDRDGDYDAVIGDSAATPRFFENTGDATAPAFLLRSTSPFLGIDLGSESTPQLNDLDGDGDLDAVIGSFLGPLRYFERTGNRQAAGFVERRGSSSPFVGLDVGFYSTPAFGDLDGDGDLDGAVGETFGSLRYMENTGSASVPGFVARTGEANPLAGITVPRNSAPQLADLDFDGDLDMVLGQRSGMLGYWENVGSSSSPVFAQATGGADPFAGTASISYGKPCLVDFDGDSDLDVVAGSRDGALSYLENTGAPNAPRFAPPSDVATLFASLIVGFRISPEVEDFDGDGDFDLLIGSANGRVVFFRSLAVLFADGFESGDTSAWSLTVP